VDKVQFADVSDTSGHVCKYVPDLFLCKERCQTGSNFETASSFQSEEPLYIFDFVVVALLKQKLIKISKFAQFRANVQVTSLFPALFDCNNW